MRSHEDESSQRAAPLSCPAQLLELGEQFFFINVGQRLGDVVSGSLEFPIAVAMAGLGPAKRLELPEMPASVRALSFALRNYILR